MERYKIAALVEAAGTPMGQADGRIAAIVRIHGFAVATRDADPFQRTGLTVINRWKAA
nr:hypothetical protein [Thioalkalivibrio sp.]